VVNGKSGIRRITQFDSSIFPCNIAGEVPEFVPAAYLSNPKDVRRTDRFAQFALASAKLALENSGLDLEGGEDSSRRFSRKRNRWFEIAGRSALNVPSEGTGRVSPFIVPMMIVNMAVVSSQWSTGLKVPITLSLRPAPPAAIRLEKLGE